MTADAELIIQQTERMQALLDTFDQWVANADQTLTQAASRYQDFSSRLHVDAAIGDDANNGSDDAPVATIGRALALAPLDRHVNIYVRGNYTSTERIELQGRHVTITGCVAGSNWERAETGPRPTLDFHVYDRDGFAETAGFWMGYNAFVDIVFFDIQLPSWTFVTTNLPAADTSFQKFRALFTVHGSGEMAPGGVSLRFGTLIVPADVFCEIFRDYAGYLLRSTNLVIDGDIAGKVHPDIPAGASPSDYGHLLMTDWPVL